MNKKIFLGFGILILLIGSFILAQTPEIENAEGVSVSYKGEEVWEISFTRENSFVEIQGNKFENILQTDKSLNPSFLKINSKGEILEADLTADEQGGDYWINGVKVHLEKGNRVYYNGKENKYILDKGASIGDVTLDYSKYPMLEKGFLVETKAPAPVLGIMLNGKAKIIEQGHLLTSGSASFNNMELITGNEPVLIAKEGMIKDLTKYTGNLILSSKNKLEMQSSKTGNFKVKFLEDSILKNEKYTKFDVNIEKGDGLKIENLEDIEIPVITHKSSENGKTIIENNGLKTTYHKDLVFINSAGLSVNDILLERYKPVPSFVASDNPANQQILTDKLGNFMVYQDFPLIFSEKYNNENSRILFEELDHENLKKIALSLKNNAGKEANLILNQEIPNLLYATRDAEFSKGQTVYLIDKITELSKDNFRQSMRDAESALRSFGRYEDIRKRDFNSETNFILNTINSANKGDILSLYSIYGSVLPIAIKNNQDLDLTADFIDKLIESKIITPASFEGEEAKRAYLFLSSVREYNGENFKEIRQGAEIASNYNVFISDRKINLKYSDIKDKQTLAKNYVSAMNSYIEAGKIDYRELEDFAMDLNEIHDAELAKEKKDEIRESIIKDLNLNAKYLLISRSGGVMYPSTFDKMYNSLPSNFVEQIKQIDAKGENLDRFTFQIASKGKLDDLLEQDAVFVKNFVKKQLVVKESEEGIIGEEEKAELIENAMFSANTINQFYKDPKYQNEKRDLENFLIENYNQAKTKEQKKQQGVYGYLLKLNENPLTEEAKKISKELPAIPIDLTIPKRYSDKKQIAAKAYFYDDETWFEESAKEFKTKYGMDLIKSTDKEAILIKKLPDNKELKIALELIPRDSFPENKEAIESDEYQVVAHRGHCFYLDKTFSEMSYSDKILYLGSCSSYEDVPEIQQKYPNAQIISDKDAGKAGTNNLIIYNLIKDISEGKKDWKELKSDFAEKEGLVFPDDKSVLLNKYIAQFYQ